MKKLLILLVALVSFVSVSAQTFEIDKSMLDTTITTVVTKHFPSNEITLCFVEYETNRPSSRVDEFIVILDNGTKLEFDRRSNLKSIECNRSIVPMSILPVRIKTFIEKKYPNVNVREYVIDRDYRLEYEVELTNGIELSFNKHCKLISTEYND